MTTWDSQAKLRRAQAVMAQMLERRLEAGVSYDEDLVWLSSGGLQSPWI